MTSRYTFTSNHNIHKSLRGLCFSALIDRFYKIRQLKGMNPKFKDQMNFYECCDLMKKVYLIYLFFIFTTTLE